MVKVRPRGARWQVDILFRWPDGTRFRERANAPVASKSAALRWAQAREAALLAGGRAAYEAAPVSAGPTLAEFWPRVMRDHYEAQRKKPSTIDAVSTIWRRHLAPALGGKRLAAVTLSDVAALKGSLATKAPKTVNNVLAVLGRILRCAVDWGVLERAPRLEEAPLLAVDGGEVDAHGRVAREKADGGEQVLARSGEVAERELGGAQRMDKRPVLRKPLEERAVDRRGAREVAREMPLLRATELLLELWRGWRHGGNGLAQEAYPSSATARKRREVQRPQAAIGRPAVELNRGCTEVRLRAQRRRREPARPAIARSPTAPGAGTKLVKVAVPAPKKPSAVTAPMTARSAMAA